MIAGAASRVPDLSGEYALDTVASRFGLESARSIESGTLSIEHRGARFRFSRVFRAKGAEYPLSFDLVIDGNEAAQVEAQRTIYTRLRWEDEELVADSRIVAPEGEASNVVRYRLADGGATFEASEVFQGPALRYENLWVFRRSARR